MWRPINEVNQVPSAGENFAAITLGREMKWSCTSTGIHLISALLNDFWGTQHNDHLIYVHPIISYLCVIVTTLSLQTLSAEGHNWYCYQ